MPLVLWQEKTLGPGDPSTLGSINNLAGCLQELGRMAEAEKLHRRAVDGLARAEGAANSRMQLL